MNKLSDEKSLLYHYTTSQGFLGIIESQQLHATSIAYLNDSEEHIGYLTRRLPLLITQWAGDAYRNMSRPTTLSEDEITSAAQEFSQRMQTGILELTKKMDDPYVVSFSAPPEYDPDDGQLSQWRAYGRDGGYALVFDTVALERLLTLENAAFHHQALLICDVDYHYDGSNQYSKPLAETVEDEQQVKDALMKLLHTAQHDSFEGGYQPLMQLSVRSKHRGFSEEKEVRIVALRSIPEVWREEKLGGEPRSQRPMRFRSKGGTMIPYVELFGAAKLGDDARLPITKVIVGPHPDKTKRRDSAERFLRQRGIDIPVVESSIPFIGG
jgi:hypothetical protein